MSRKKKKKAKWLQRLEYALYRAVARRAGRASRDSARKWGARFGTVARNVVRRRDRRAMRNLRLAFPDKQEAELRAILDECWRHFGRQAVEYIRRQQLPADEAIRDVQYVNLEAFREAQDLGRGVVIVSAHYGSWEVAGLTVMSLARDVRTVVRKLDNEYLERQIAATRARTGAVVIYRRQAARPLMKALAEKAVIVLLPDQAVVPREGVLVPFLGRPAWTTPAPARLALHHGSPIVFAFCIPDGAGHRLEFEGPIRIDRLSEEERDPVALTQRINDVIARRIVARPELWLWMHDRWKGTGESETVNG
ncbi:MAG TPA: lysophospholipid acyltransferase family protein [Thermoanaerobaculia bacterium]|nr:lysophospholipid acyltransferase family protein [Thermoanaerobaculia bacterium]